MELLEYIRSRDTETKAQAALLVAGGITLLIGAVWISTFSARLSPVTLDNRNEEDSNEKYTESRSFGEIIGEAKSQLGSLMNAKDELKEDIVNMAEEETTAIENDTEISPVIDNNSALGTLTMPNEVGEGQATSTPLESEPIPVQENTTSSSTVAIEEPKVPEPPKEPRVILIGTTTGQKIE